MCIVRGKGAKQRGRNKNRPLTLSAVTRAAASRRRRQRSQDSQITAPVSGLVAEFHPALVQQVASVSSFAVAACFFKLLLKSLVIF